MKHFRDKHQMRLILPALLLLLLATHVVETGWKHKLLLLAAIFLSAIALVRCIRENRSHHENPARTNEFDF